MRFMQLLRILRAHRSLILLSLIAAWVVAGVVTLLVSERYVATSSVLVNFADSTSVTAKPPVALYAGYLATQIDLLTSQTVALKVVDRLQLATDDAARARYFGKESSVEAGLQKVKDSVRALIARVTSDKSAEQNTATAGPDDERYRSADLLLKHITVRPSPDSSVIQVSYAADSPAAAAVAANAIVKAYIDSSLELNVNPARASSDWLDAQVQTLTETVQQARTALADFQQRSGILATSDANDTEAQRLNDLNSQLVAAQAQNHPAIQALKSDLARALAKLNELPPQLGPNHPAFQRAQSEVQQLRAQLASESSRLASELRQEIARQRGSMLTMKREVGQATALKEEVDNAQRALDDATQRASQARMNSQVTQTNVSVIRVAAPPRRPTSPNALFNFALASMVGLVFGAGLGLWREVVCRFVRSADDIRDFLGVQVLGVLHGGPRSSSGRSRLPNASASLLTAER